MSDVLESLAAVTFYKWFVLAPRYGQPLPGIEWSADRSTAQEAINQLEDEPLRDLLNREYQARRALANSLADVKARVENKLYLNVQDQPSQELLPLSEARFFVPMGFDFYQFDFAPDEPSQTWRVVLTLGGMSVTARRK